MNRHYRLVPVARPGWRNRWVVVRETFAEFLTLVGLIATIVFVLFWATWTGH